jgi:D-3-phosphoglycerate dehydrogenase
LDDVPRRTESGGADAIVSGVELGPIEPLVVITPNRFSSFKHEQTTLRAFGARVVSTESMEEVLDLAPSTDALLVSSFVKVNRELVDRLTHCRAIVRYGVGTDNVDVTAATMAGIPVGNVPDASVEEVADHTLLLSLALLRDLPAAVATLESGRWGTEGMENVRRLSTLIVGVVGFGRIGRAVASRFAALGCSIKVADPFATYAAPYELVDLDQLLTEADVVTLHLPLDDSTYHLLSADRLALLRPTSIVVNVSRGGLVDEIGLADALNSGSLGGAALDVFEQEPLPLDHPLRSAARALLTPHVAFYSEAATHELQRLAAKQVARALAGARLEPVVNPSVYAGQQ